MRLLTWNIRHGGGKRVERILEVLAGARADALVLTEYRENAPGARLRDGLRSMGFDHQHAGTRTSLNTLLIATRTPSIRAASWQVPGELAQRCIPVEWEGIGLIGVYFALGRRKIPLFEHLLALPAEILSRPALLLGDFNTGRHYLDEAGATFIVPEYLAKLETRGWIDLWRHVHPQGREFSWFSPRGNGFRIDHALGTPAFQGLVRSVEYSHRERECGISDHSVLVLDAGAPAPSA